MFSFVFVMKNLLPYRSRGLPKVLLFRIVHVPPTVVLNDQVLLTGLGETIDNIGYLGSRIERLERIVRPKSE